MLDARHVHNTSPDLTVSMPVVRQRERKSSPSANICAAMLALSSRKLRFVCFNDATRSFLNRAITISMTSRTSVACSKDACAPRSCEQRRRQGTRRSDSNAPLDRSQPCPTPPRPDQLLSTGGICPCAPAHTRGHGTRDEVFRVRRQHVLRCAHLGDTIVLHLTRAQLYERIFQLVVNLIAYQALIVGVGLNLVEICKRSLRRATNDREYGCVYDTSPIRTDSSTPIRERFFAPAVARDLNSRTNFAASSVSSIRAFRTSA